MFRSILKSFLQFFVETQINHTLEELISHTTPVWNTGNNNEQLAYVTWVYTHYRLQFTYIALAFYAPFKQCDISNINKVSLYVCFK
jgi:hypothetical protein